MKTHSTKTQHHTGHGTPARRAPGLIPALCAAFLATSAVSYGQTWETVGDAEGPTSEYVYGITTDSAGNIFAAGTMNKLGANGVLSYAVVMKSSDGGQRWDSDPSTPGVDEPSDATVPPSDGSYAGFHAIASARTTAGEDHLVTGGRDGRVPGGAGFQFSPYLNGRWIVRRSLDAGATWVTLDQFTHPSYNMLNTYSGLWGAAVDSNGNIYVAGYADKKVVTVKRGTTTTTTVSLWLIRKGLATANGMEWSTVGDFAGTRANNYPDYQATCPRGVACVGNDVYVVGSNDGSWIVRKSSDGGATWQVVDTFRLTTSDDCQAYGLAADRDGNVFVVGSGKQTVTIGSGKNATRETRTYWVVRKGTGGGTSWTEVDRFGYSNNNAVAYAVTVDRNNDVHVTGSGWPTSTTQRWITRQRSAVTGEWSTTEDFASASTGSSGGKSITADPSGNVFAAGYGDDAAGARHGWLVRRKTAP